MPYICVMVNKCCVPGCNSNYDSTVAKEGLIRCFSFPKDENTKKIWLRKISRQNLPVTKNTVVCIKHFNDQDVVKEDILPGRDGNPDIVIPRTKFQPRKGAVSCIFSNVPSYLSKRSSSKPRLSNKTTQEN